MIGLNADSIVASSKSVFSGPGVAGDSNNYGSWVSAHVANFFLKVCQGRAWQASAQISLDGRLGPLKPLSPIALKRGNVAYVPKTPFSWL